MRRHAKSAVQRFSPTDRRRLERALSVAREARLYRRIEAVLLVAEGQPISEAARRVRATRLSVRGRSEEHTSELQSRQYLVCRLLLEKKKNKATSCWTSPPAQ